MLGCIPIVEKYESHNNWNDLPILFLDNIRDYELLTEDFLTPKFGCGYFLVNPNFGSKFMFSNFLRINCCKIRLFEHVTTSPSFK
jgi:hypothetical protein